MMMADEPMAFQEFVGTWLAKTFADDICKDTLERAMRFLEEAAELCQSVGMTHEQANTVSRYVFGRPIGEPAQEVGGAMVTLAALCWATDLDMTAAGWVEINRIDTPEMRAKIAAKQVSKRLFGMTGPIAREADAMLAARKDAAATIRAAMAEIERLRNVLVEIAGLTHRRQLPITAQIHEVALAALGKGERP